jgi:hypothetical protein
MLLMPKPTVDLPPGTGLKPLPKMLALAGRSPRSVRVVRTYWRQRGEESACDREQEGGNKSQR